MGDVYFWSESGLAWALSFENIRGTLRPRIVPLTYRLAKRTALLQLTNKYVAELHEGWRAGPLAVLFTAMMLEGDRAALG
jgi:hypothetical protein